MNATRTAARLLEDEDVDPKDYVMGTTVVYRIVGRWSSARAHAGEDGWGKTGVKYYLTRNKRNKAFWVRSRHRALVYADKNLAHSVAEAFGPAFQVETEILPAPESDTAEL